MIVDYLGDNGMRVTSLGSGEQIAAVLARDEIDLIVLDLRLPNEDGMEIARKLREESAALPIIMLTGRKDEADRVMGLELGADDYLTKPFSPRELLARIRALLRRSQTQQTVADGLQKIRVYRFAGWELNVRLRRLASPEGKNVPLTRREFNLLAAFLAGPQRVLSRDQLLALSRLHNDEVYDRSVDVQVGRLRRKIQPSDRSLELIRTERGVGYVFTAPVDIVRSSNFVRKQPEGGAARERWLAIGPEGTIWRCLSRYTASIPYRSVARPWRAPGRASPARIGRAMRRRPENAVLPRQPPSAF